MPRVLLSILLYNSEKFLANFFQSLEAITYPKPSLVFFILDNDSSDNSYEQACHFKERVAARGFEAVVVKNETNEGFAGGHNHAMRYAAEHQFPYIYLLNSDTSQDPRFLEEAVAVAEADPQTALVQSLILLYPDKNKINTAGNALHYLGFGYAYGEKDSLNMLPHYEKFLETQGYASGAGVLIRTEALKTIGRFDPYLFLYHEDLDMSYRARLAGLRIKLAPRSVVYHEYDFHRSTQKFYYMERNRFYVLFSNYQLWTIALIFPALLFTEIGLFIFAVFQGWGWTKLRAYGHMLKPKTWHQILVRKEEISRLRKLSDREMADFLTPIIEFQDLRHPLLLYILNPLLTVYWKIIKPLL